MDALPKKCADINTVSLFCDCIAGENNVDPVAKTFCSMAKTNKNTTGGDLDDLKIALMNLEDEACCDC